MLSVLEELPKGLLELTAEEIHALLHRPTLIHLPGRREPPLYVSVLLHGNEYTGWLALRELLLRYHGELLPRALSIFIGNVTAANQGLRHLPGQPDYNRIWNGGESAEQRMASQILETMSERGVFASVDLHNNTGINPHYACVNALEPSYLHLATLFSRTVVYFIRPDSVSSMAFAALCPAVTLECGFPGHTYGTEHALDFLDACLNLSEHPAHPVAPHDIDLFHTVATVKVPHEVSFGFEENASEIWFASDLDHLNFREIPKDTLLGWTHEGSSALLEAWSETGKEVGEYYFENTNGEIRTTVPVIPSMLTTDQRVIRQDCLCYLMERYRLPY